MQTTKWIFFSLSLFIFGLSAQENVITEIPPGGMVISTPGTYVFGNDIIWSPSANANAILIISPDVTLDLHHFKLRSDTNAFTTTGIAALVSANLTIKNGTLENMTYRGIDCTGCTDLVVDHIIVDGLSIEETVIYTVPVGILASASTRVLVSNCRVKNINVRTGSCAAIQMTATTHSEIVNCSISNLLNRDGACTGIGQIGCDVAKVVSCKLNKITTQFIDNLNTAGHTAIGLIPFLSTNICLKDCEVTNVTGSCDDAHGISVFECTNAIVNNCRVSHVLDGAGPAETGAKATGIEIYGSDVKVINCSVDHISAINPQDRQATGFSCAQGSRIKFINCHAKHVTVVNALGIEDAALGFGTGFGWAPDPRIIEPAVDVLYKNCSAKFCYVGFDSWFHINSVWDHIYSKCNCIPILNLGDSAERSLSCDACSECGCTFPGCFPDPFTITITNVANNNIFLNVKKKKCH